MFPLGILGLFQMAFIPGYLCLKLSRWQARSGLQFLVYAFALSLLVNFYLVYALVSLGLYTRASVWRLIGLEICAGVSLLRGRAIGSVSQVDLSEELRRRFKNIGASGIGGCLAVGIAVASFCSYGRLLYRSFGSVFNVWDDVVSWNRWAQDSWAANLLPTDTGLYPQLLPANWSLSYVMLGATDVQMFAKALMPLFPIPSEPLLQLGRGPGAADALGVKYLPGDLMVLFLDHWGQPGCESSPVPALRNEPYRAEFWMHPQDGGTSVILNGEHLFDCGAVYDQSLGGSVLGKNTIGFTTMSAAFSGAIEPQPGN